jgi:hypothetical protein
MCERYAKAHKKSYAVQDNTMYKDQKMQEREDAGQQVIFYGHGRCVGCSGARNAEGGRGQGSPATPTQRVPLRPWRLVGNQEPGQRIEKSGL